MREYNSENQFSNYVLAGEKGQQVLEMLESSARFGYVIILDANMFFRPQSVKGIEVSSSLLDKGYKFNNGLVELLRRFSGSVNVPGAVRGQIINVMEQAKAFVYMKFDADSPDFPINFMENANDIQLIFKEYSEADKIPEALMRYFINIDLKFGCQKQSSNEEADLAIASTAFLQACLNNRNVIITSNDCDVKRLMFCGHYVATENLFLGLYESAKKLRQTEIQVVGMSNGQFQPVFNSKEERPKNLVEILKKMGVRESSLEIQHLIPSCSDALLCLDDLAIKS